MRVVFKSQPLIDDHMVNFSMGMVDSLSAMVG